LHEPNRDSEMALRRDLVRKIRQQRGVHDQLADAVRWQIAVLKTSNVIVTAFMSLVVFADFGLILKLAPQLSGFVVSLTVGCAAFLLFVANALADTFNIHERHASHQRTIHQLSELLRDVRKAYLESLPPEQAKPILHQLNERYMHIMAASENVGTRQFELAQAAYLRQQARRLARKEDPFASWFTVRKRAREKVKLWQEVESEL